jgi:hypothetical protein
MRSGNSIIAEYWEDQTWCDAECPSDCTEHRLTLLHAQHLLKNNWEHIAKVVERAWQLTLADVDRIAMSVHGPNWQTRPSLLYPNSCKASRVEPDPSPIDWSSIELSTWVAISKSSWDASYYLHRAQETIGEIAYQVVGDARDNHAWDVCVEAILKASKGDRKAKAHHISKTGKEPWNVAWQAAHDAVMSARKIAWKAAADCASLTVQALAVRHLVGTRPENTWEPKVENVDNTHYSGLRQEHYDHYTEIWRAVIDRIHPDDDPVGFIMETGQLMYIDDDTQETTP